MNFFSNIRSLLSSLLVLILMTAQTPTAQAIIIYGGTPPNNTTNVSNADTFILDNDNSAADIILQFGATLNESLRWNEAQNYFELSDALVVDGNLNQNGNTFRLDFDNAGAGADVSIVAEQGSDSDGTIRYNSTTNQWEISNNGGAFRAITDADTLDALDSAQFLRSDTSDNFTSGTLTTDNGTTFAVNGTANIGDGGDGIAVNSSSWDISSGGAASGFTGMTSTGAVNYTGATFRGPQGASDPVTCSVGEEFYNTTSGLFKICTSADTWSSLVRSDTSQTFTAGTFTFNSGTTLNANGVINFSGATSFRAPQGAADPGTCLVGQEFYNTTTNSFKICTATNTWTTAVSPNGADLIDGLNSDQFLRSDASDNFTSGTLATDNGTTFTVNGIANIGDGGDNIAVNSNSWDVSSAGVASGFTGFTSTGSVNLSGTSSLRIREVADEATATCTTVKEVVLDTTENRIYVCTVVGSPGTWTAPAAGASDFEAVYAADAGKNLVTTNNPFSITTGVDDFVVDSNDWNVTAAGALDAVSGTFNSVTSGRNGTDGLFTLFSEQGGTDFSVNFQPHAGMTQTTNYTLPPDDGTAGQVLLTDGTGAMSWGSPYSDGLTGFLVTKYKSAAQTNNTITLANDTHLQFSMGASEVWAVRYTLNITSSGNRNIQVAWVIPSGATCSAMFSYRNSPSTGTGIITNCTASTAVTIGNSGSGKVVDIDVVFVNSTTPGAATFQWASSGGTNGIVIEAGSFMRANKAN